MQVFSHCLYEFQKGVRRLVLLTLEIYELNNIISRLEKEKIPHHFQYLKNKKANLYFGDEYCVQVAKMFGKKPLNELSTEEDFILGIMLGYDLKQQCSRYISKKTTS
jgi:hypothetical protein